MKARVSPCGADGAGGADRAGVRDWEIDLDRPLSLAIETHFAHDSPSGFGAPRADARPLVVAGFTGRVATGASCNCSTLTLTPHCNGTHTECAGHLTAQPLDVIRIVPAGLVTALLITVTPERASREAGSAGTRASTGTSRSTGASAGTPGDCLITSRVLDAAWLAAAGSRAPPAPAPPRALVIRTLPNDEAKRHRDYTGGSAPYLTEDAARSLVERGIEHLVVDLPSIDRMADDGRLAAHRAFFGLPLGATDLALAARAHCTVTELAYVADSIGDGQYLLQLQVPALAGDAVPSRPLLYAPERP
ncbi:MAG: cyclase family protein [Steroidobacteraceae bacterium]